jgi:hypothetical protein
VCYKDEKNTDAEYAFVVVPGMYNRDHEKLPAYKLIVNEKGSIKIRVDELKETTDKFVSECIDNVKQALEKYITIETYLDNIFMKDNTTKYKRKQPGVRKIELNIVEDEEPTQIQIETKTETKPETKPKKDRKPKKIARTLSLIEAEEAQEQTNKALPDDKVLPADKVLAKPKTIIEDKEVFEIILPAKKAKTKAKTKKNKPEKEVAPQVEVVVNPPSKKAKAKAKAKTKKRITLVIDDKKEEVY